MINLLPDETKRDIKAARSNVVLLRYNLLTVIAAGCLVIVCAFFFFVLSNDKSNAVSKNSENQAKAASYASTKAAANEYKQNLATAKTILDKSVDYTSTIFEISKLLPPGVVLDGLTLTADDFGKQKTFTANAKSYADATKLKENFQNSKLFTNVFFQTINNQNVSSSQSSSSTDSAYPVQVVLSAQLNKVVAP